MDAHCPRCGGALVAHDDHGVARQRCGRCARVHYRNSKPAVSAILVRDGHVLLSRRAREPHKGMWDLPGGFLESGEHPEEGLRREIREETGLDATIVRLVHIGMGTYDGADTLNLAYEVRADGEPTAMDDSLELRFVKLDALPVMAFGHEAEAVRRYSSRST